jgi:transposase
LSGQLLSHSYRRSGKRDPPIGRSAKSKGGIFYQLKNGCNWGDLPLNLPPYSTVFWYYKQWRCEGVIDSIRDALHAKVREQVKKKQKWTRLLLIDSQAVKNTCNASVDSRMLLFLQIDQWH